MTPEYLCKLDELVDEGWLSKSVKGGLVSYNYTKQCQHDRHWNELTLNARGTIYNSQTGQIVARAFPKFFNEFEPEAANINWNQEIVSVATKADGSLGIFYVDQDGQPSIATRGSFYSEQAVKATEMIRTKYRHTLFGNVTPLFEIIYPENRIVLDYGTEEKLVLLSVLNLNGDTMDHAFCEEYAEACGFELAKQHPDKYGWTHQQFVDYVNSLPWTEEGLVIRFADNTSVKVKSPEYMRVAKARANLNYLWVWECGRNNWRQEVLKLPDELWPEANKLGEDIENWGVNIVTNCFLLRGQLDLIGETDRKLYAEKVKKAPDFYQKFLFKMFPLTGWAEEVFDMAWKACRPVGGELPKIENIGGE